MCTHTRRDLRANILLTCEIAHRVDMRFWRPDKWVTLTTSPKREGEPCPASDPPLLAPCFLYPLIKIENPDQTNTTFSTSIPSLAMQLQFLTHSPKRTVEGDCPHN